MAKKNNIEVVATAALASGICSDPTPVIGPVLAGKPEVIVLNLYTDDTISSSLKALRNLGVTALIVGSGSGIAVKTISRSAGQASQQPDGHYRVERRSADQGRCRNSRPKWKAAFPEEKLLPQEAAGEGRSDRPIDGTGAREGEVDPIQR